MKINVQIKNGLLLFLLCWITQTGSANWYLLSGNISSEWRLEMTSEINAPVNNLIILFDYYEPYNYSNGFSSQQIIALSKDYKGDTFTETKTYDPVNQLKRLFIPLKKGIFFMHKSYKFKSESQLDTLYVDSAFPSKLPHTQQLYLSHFSLPEEFKEKIRAILKNKTQIADIILGISNWIKNDFQFVLSSKKITLKEAVKTKQLNFCAVIDLWISSLRFAGIPARIVHGYSLSNQINLEKGEEILTVHYPRGNYHWIEFFSGNLGWLPIDPWANIFFFTPNNLLRKTVAINFKDKQDRIFVYPKKIPDLIFNYNIFSEKESKEKKYKIESQIETNDILLSPPTNTQEKPNKTPQYPLKFIPDLLDLYQNPLKIDVEITEEKSVSQKINFSRSKKIHTITLPLYFLEINRFGQLWLELQHEGKIYKSEIVKTNYDKLDMKYKLISFKMPQELAFQGEVIIRLKIKNLATVFWYGIIGNPIGDKKDTFREKNHILHLDLCYEIK